MGKNLFLLCLLFAVLLPCRAQTQTTTAVYSGLITDPQSHAIEYATVVLLQSDKQIAGVTTDSTGHFGITAKAGSYTLIIQCLGYESIRKGISIPTASPEKIILQPSAYALKGVVIQARNIERKPDRFIVSVSPSGGKDGTELLSQAPGVWLSGDKISINGASGTKVFVDHREVKLNGEELLSYLRSLKSADIKQIEVVPMAGAEYDASSSGGIIQITLRRRQNNGVQGNVMMGTAFAPSLSRYLPSGTINARIGKWIINAAASSTFTPRDGSELTSVRLYPDNKSDFSSSSSFDIHSNYGTGRIGTIFEIDTLNSIGAEIEYISQSAKGASHSETALSNGNIATGSKGEYYQRNAYNTLTATANYLHKLDQQGSVVKWIVDYANKQSTGRNDYQIVRQASGWKNDSTYRSNADATYNILTTDLSFSKYLRKTTSIHAGVKYTYTDMDDNSYYEGRSPQGGWDINPAYGYAMKYNENIIGAYAAFSAELGRLSLKAGLRGEYTHTSNRSNTFDRNYFDLFPNLNATYAFDRMKTQILVAQYSRNIERPAFYALSPNHIQLSDYSYQIGNPHLKPTYINRFSLTWVYNYRYTVTIGGNLHHNLIREFCKQDALNGDISYITYENHDHENHWFIAINMPFQPAPWCNLTANFVGVKQDIRMTTASAFSSHYLMFANATATFNLPSSYSIELQYSGANRLYSGNSEVAPRHTLDFSVRKKCMNERLLITAGVNNIFNRFNSYSSSLDAYRIESDYKEARAGRQFKVSLSWNFNSGKKIGKSKIEKSGNDELNRLNKNI